jgi:UDP-N-acetylmuramoylalanine--D-glutamate ligase
MKFHLPELEQARRRGVAVTSEMEVFFDVCPCRIIAVTGSDGKTTTTSLIADMLRRQGYTVHIGGNIGKALLPEAASMRREDIAVVELSSFQLISMRRSPDIAVVTNVSPNHLDMHKDMAEYVGAKKNIFLHQNAFGRTVLNLDNAVTASFVPEVRGECLLFSRKAPVDSGTFLDADGRLVASGRGGREALMESARIRIPGLHNVENMLAACAAVRGLVKPEIMRETAETFAGVEHRIEFVRELDGVKYYNDSIATTPTRTIAGLHAFGRPVVLIAGGYDKKIPFDALGPEIARGAKALILLGVTADQIEKAVREAPEFSPEKLPIVHVSSLKEAVEEAKRRAVPGDIVTLSPACASFDMFKNFETRGDVFKEIVNSL